MPSLRARRTAVAGLVLIGAAAVPPLWADSFSCQARLEDAEGRRLPGYTVVLRALRNDETGRPVIEAGSASGQTDGNGDVTVSVDADPPVNMLRCSTGPAWSNDPEVQRQFRNKFNHALSVLHEPNDGLPDGSQVVLTPDIAPDPDVTRTFRGLKDGDATARLYQSGPYDHVIVIPEPFNRREQSEDFGVRSQYDLWRKFEVFLPTLYNLGYDVWVVQAWRAGENIHEQAAAAAQAIAYAASHAGGPAGGKVVVAGFSLAGPVVRIATARWQSDPEWRTHVGLPEAVPASLIIFGDAPLRGAQVNVDLQRLLWATEHPDKVNLNSCTAQQLIRSGIASVNGIPGANERRFRIEGAPITFAGNGTCDYFDGLLCHCDAGPAVESLGYATGIRKIAFSNGTWDPPQIQCYGDARDEEYDVNLCPLPGGPTPWTPTPGSVYAHVEIPTPLPIPPVCRDIAELILGVDLTMRASADDVVAGSRHDGLINESFPTEYPVCDMAFLFQHFSPTFMPITSALDTDVPYSRGPFNDVRFNDHHSFHESVPESTLGWLLNEIAAATGGTPPDDGGGNENAPPQRPSDLLAVPVPLGEDQVKLTWRDNSHNERGFVIYRLRSGENGWVWRGDVDPNVTEFDDTVNVLPVPPDTTAYYFYKVQAYNAAGESGWSDWAPANMYEPVPFRPITDAPPGCADSLRPRLHWFGANYSSTYEVAVWDEDANRLVFYDDRYTREELVLPELLVPGHRYSYVVAGRNNLHRGPYAERRYFIPLCTPLTPPVVRGPQGCVNDTLRPTLDWDPVPNARGYIVKLREVTGGPEDGWVFPADDLPWTPDDQFKLSFDLHAGHEYWFQVKAGDSVNTGGWSPIRFFTVQCAAGSAPGIASALSPSGQVSTSTPTYRWETGHDATSYRLVVNRRPDNWLAYEGIHAASDVCTATNCEVTPATSLPPGSYYFQVESRNAYGVARMGPFANFTVPLLPTLTIADAAVAENGTGDVEAHVRLTLDAPASTPVRLRWRTVDDTAHAPGDYVPRDEAATFAAGQTQLDLVVRVHNDAVHEGPERFFVRISDLQGAGATDTEASVTIADDDSVPVLLAADVLQTEPAAGSQLASGFRIDAVGASEQPIDVPYAITPCTATPGQDYVTVASGSLHFEGGASSQTVPFELPGDHQLEGHELFTLTLGAATGATIGKSYANATILEHDGPALSILRADFDHDGHNDVVWYDSSANRYGIWSMHGPHRLGEKEFEPAAPADLNWKLAGVGDFDGNATPDLLWRNQDSGRLAVWFMNGVERTGAAVFDGRPDATVAGVANLGGDLTPDTLWRANDKLGTLSVWIMRGVTPLHEEPLTPSAPADKNWKLQAVVDLDSNGSPDLLWRHAVSGALVAWLMDGTTRVDGRPLTPSAMSDLNWTLASASDIDANGTTDLLWQHQASGKVVAWFMDGTTRRCGAYLINDAAGRLALGPR